MVQPTAMIINTIINHFLILHPLYLNFLVIVTMWLNMVKLLYDRLSIMDDILQYHYCTFQ
ncbi:hypothetical protein COJ50_20000 [Bacillus cereus]|uniref:Uncharacterized protein n=1 Tax=Bacillus cereus TaxID=1396 RepID=A0A2A8RCK2_BACCE|nr:hypothetical protein CN450_06660 [Bacillus cereus]PFN21508.1 hypothetical protein COJ50_20000 [Bacillus cereus]